MVNGSFPFGYCTNVHAGVTWEEAKANLEKFAVAVRSQVCPEAELPIGLWLAEKGAAELLANSQVSAFRDWLRKHGLAPYTLNGFPQGDFHQTTVKYAVYEPTWACQSRLQYTLLLAEILDAWLQPGETGSISTLPLGWPHAPWHAENYKAAADNLIEAAKFLDRLAQRRGGEIVLAIEPEPGCVLNTADEVMEFYEHYLFSTPNASLVRQYITVCHDICHSGVMFESQEQVLRGYRERGIRVGKVQVSSAVHVPWDQCRSSATKRVAVLQQLRALAEPKYLHQTTRCVEGTTGRQLMNDLPAAIDNWLIGHDWPEDPWRIHFHVPVFVDAFGALTTTQDDIIVALRELESSQSSRIDARPWFTGHYEVETYAWPVLPPELSVDDLADGIARELRYVHSKLNSIQAAIRQPTPTT